MGYVSDSQDYFCPTTFGAILSDVLFQEKSVYTKGEIIQVIMITSPPMQRILGICFLICIFKNKMNTATVVANIIK